MNYLSLRDPILHPKLLEGGPACLGHVVHGTTARLESFRTAVFVLDFLLQGIDSNLVVSIAPLLVLQSLLVLLS